jgi:predicted transcriptional regulator
VNTTNYNNNTTNTNTTNNTNTKKLLIQLKALGLPQRQIARRLNMPMSSMTRMLADYDLTNDPETYFIKEIVRCLKRDKSDYVFEQWQVDRVKMLLPNVKSEKIDWYFRLTLI